MKFNIHGEEKEKLRNVAQLFSYYIRNVVFANFPRTKFASYTNFMFHS